MNIQAGQVSIGILNIVMSLILGFIAIWIGMILGKLINCRDYTPRIKPSFILLKWREVVR